MSSSICSMIECVNTDSKANLAIISVMRKSNIFCAILDDGKIYPVNEFSRGEEPNKTLVKAMKLGFIYLKVFDEDEVDRVVPISRVKEFTLGRKPIDDSTIREIKDLMKLDSSSRSVEGKIGDSLARVHENLMGSEHKDFNNSRAFK